MKELRFLFLAVISILVFSSITRFLGVNQTSVAAILYSVYFAVLSVYYAWAFLLKRKEEENEEPDLDIERRTKIIEVCFKLGLDGAIVQPGYDGKVRVYWWNGVDMIALCDWITGEGKDGERALEDMIQIIDRKAKELKGERNAENQGH